MRSGMAVIVAVGMAGWVAAGPWRPNGGDRPAELTTRWTKGAEAGEFPVEYPRPQLVRGDWLHLNGLWQYAVRPRGEERPGDGAFDGSIRVPFPIQSQLSGVQKAVSAGEHLWYRRTFAVPANWASQRVWLHFGAVDWEAEVWVNGRQVGEHRGGYDPFSFDITEALTDGGEQELVVRVWDPIDESFQPRGKQVRQPGGIWYTPTTGIWQTVWLEPVAATSFEWLRTIADVEAGSATIEFTARGLGGDEEVRVEVFDAGRPVARATAAAGEGRVAVRLPEPHRWSPSDPHLYDLNVELRRGDRAVDSIASYFALRQVRLGPDESGKLRILLNGEPLFQIGLLDQGFWPDGLYAAPCDEALEYDLQVTRRLGFNMIRKHVKVEPARWYHHCDRLGLLVWQDMPSGDQYIGGNDADLVRSPESTAVYETEFRELIHDFSPFACIVMWVPFNEGWGQFDTPRIVELARALDPTRLVNSASGWTDRGVGDVHDVHAYPGPGMPPLSQTRAAVLGEFGGLGLPLDGHTWQAKDNWGYRSFDNVQDLNEAYVQLIDRLRPLIGRGLSAAVYTQTTDVEIEVNGIMTYDREVIKLDESRVAAAHRRLHEPPPIVTEIVATSREKPQTWRYATDEPAEGWTEPTFDDGKWSSGPGGFGTPSTPGAVVGSAWSSNDIWLRRTIAIPETTSGDLWLLVHHDEDAEIFLDGRPLAELSGYTVDYESVAIAADRRGLLTPGEHVLAVHCRQTAGGQFIDVGMARVTEHSASDAAAER